MQIFRTQEVQFSTPCVLTVGTFDGVHLGHQQLLKTMIAYAREKKLPAVVLSFYPSAKDFFGSKKLNLLSLESEKLTLFKKLGVDIVVFYPFTLDFSTWSGEIYIQRIWLKKLKVHTAFVGHDHHFGKGGAENYQNLLVYSKKYNFEVYQIPAVYVKETIVSSTKIRQALDVGDIGLVSACLERFYVLEGVVVHGQKQGRILGFPTANLKISEAKKLPLEGVYAVYVWHAEKKYYGMMNLGKAPTISDGKNQKIEVHLFNFQKEIYGETLKVELVKYWRLEKKFTSFSELESQLKQDSKDIQVYFSIFGR